MRKVILSVVSHPDDEILGFGATAAKFAREGHDVINCILSGQVQARRLRPKDADLMEDIKKAQQIIGATNTVLGNFPNIKFNTVPHLDLVQFIEKTIEEVEPDLIFTHFPNDLNNDHFHTSMACQAASRLFQRKKMKPLSGLYFMEVLSSTEWAFPIGGNGFLPDTFVEIGDEMLEIKMKALQAYRGVMRDFPHPRSNEVLRGLAAYRGAQAGMKYAEAFKVAFNNLKLD